MRKGRIAFATSMRKKYSNGNIESEDNRVQNGNASDDDEDDDMSDSRLSFVNEPQEHLRMYMRQPINGGKDFFIYLCSYS